jgi:fibronectin-binding autotransporter adhesin
MAKLLSGTRIYGTGTVDTSLIINGAIGTNSTSSGALRVVGGVGVSGGVFVGGVVTATTFVGTFSGTASLATDVAGGTAGQLLYQIGVNDTGFAGPGSVGQLLVSAGTAAPTYTSTASIYVNRAVLADNDSGGAAGGLRYQTGANASTFLSIGTAGQMLRVNAGATAPEWVGTASIYVNSAVNAQRLFGGTAGQLVYQSAVGTTAFAGPGSVGQILVSAGTAAPTYTNTGSIYVGFADSSNNIRAGTAGQIPYQTGANATTFFGPGTAGQILVSAGTAAPTYTSTGSIYVGRALVADSSTGNAASSTTATNIAGGTAGQVPYQTGPGATSFYGPGSFGQFLMSNGTNAPLYQNTLTQSGGSIVVASNNAASSTSTGALQVVNGGAGIGGGLVVGGISTVTNTTNATNTATGALQVRGGAGIAADLWVGGALFAVTKSFLINHPTQADKKLRYGSLESPYHGVRLTGEAAITGDTVTVDLPEYICGLCKQEGSQVQLTNIKHDKTIWVENIDVPNNKFTVAVNRGFFDKKQYSFYWSFTAIRRDIEDIVVEF